MVWPVLLSENRSAFFDNVLFGGQSPVGHQLWIPLKDGPTTAVYRGVMTYAILKAEGKICGGPRMDRDIGRDGERVE